MRLCNDSLIYQAHSLVLHHGSAIGIDLSLLTFEPVIYNLRFHECFRIKFSLIVIDDPKLRSWTFYSIDIYLPLQLSFDLVCYKYKRFPGSHPSNQNIAIVMRYKIVCTACCVDTLKVTDFLAVGAPLNGILKFVARHQVKRGFIRSMTSK